MTTIKSKQMTFAPTDKMHLVTVIYSFNHSKMGFNNSITVDAMNEEHAIENAKYEVACVYGSKMLTRFTFKIK